MSPSDRSARPEYKAPALERGLDILEYLAGCSGPISQIDLARGVGSSPGSIFRMIDRLQARGYILRDPATGSIELTLRLYELAHSHSVTGRFLRAARDPMERFAAATGHSCHLGVRHGGNLLILMERLPVHRVCLAVGEGSIQPLFRSNSGRLILAGMGSEAPRLLGKDPAFLALGASQRKSFLASLAGILPDDVLTAGSLLNPGVRDLAVSAGIQGTDAAAVLATPILAETDPGRIREELLAAAQEIRKGMGLGGA